MDVVTAMVLRLVGGAVDQRSVDSSSVAPISRRRQQRLRARLLAVWRRSDGECTSRLVGLDVARCLAIIGMIAAHTEPKIVNGHVPWQQTVVAGRAAGLFAVLAGISLSLMSGGTRPVRGARHLQVGQALAVRAAIITAIGLALEKAHDQGLGVILPYYGLLFLVGIPFLGFSARVLFALAGGCAIAMPVASQVIRAHLPAVETTRLSQMNFEQLVSYLSLTGNYPVLTWTAFLFTGMAVGRLALGSKRTLLRLGVAGAVLAVFASAVSDGLTRTPSVQHSLVASWSEPGADWHSVQQAMGAGLSGVTPTGSWWWLAVQGAHTGTPFDLAQTTGCALAVIALAVRLAQYRPPVWRVIFGAGAMSLTSYALHVIMLNPHVPPDLGRPQFWPETIVLLALGAIFALLRLRGPLEGLITSAARMGAGARWLPARPANQRSD